MLAFDITHYVHEAVAIKQLGDVTVAEIPETAICDVISRLASHHSLPLKLIDATDERQEHGVFKVWYVFGVPASNHFIALYVPVTGARFTSVTSVLHQAGLYERKIQSFFGLEPVGARDKRSFILHEENWPKSTYPLRKDFDPRKLSDKPAGEYQFHKVYGEGVYEIPVGPIHAGIIEPGHFRFSVAGEEIILLEARLGYVHKGSEKMFEQLPMADKLRLSEKISGDSSFSHSLAFCQAIENLAGVIAPERAAYLRLIFAEMERIACHVGDIGFIMLDTGFNFGGYQGARLREGILRLNDKLSGSRFMRGVNALGGVSKGLTQTELKQLQSELTKFGADFEEMVAAALASKTLRERLNNTGRLDPEVAKDHGVVGVSAKAVGLGHDTRIDFPYAAYNDVPLQSVVTQPSGDVYARFMVRINEVRASIELIRQAAKKMPTGALRAELTKLPKNSVAVGCVEGWRGDITYFVATDDKGNLSRVVVRDPSFVNWQVVGYCGAGNMVPDFPLINKSFNLSYTGNDL